MIRALVTALVIVVAGVAAAGAAPMPPVPADGRIDMVILRDGNPIGSHTIVFRRDGARLIVETRINVRVRILFVTAYRYQATSREVWRDGRVVGYEATIDDNGTTSRVTVREDGAGLAIAGPSGDHAAPAGTMISGYWSIATVDQTRLIDSTTGALRRVAFVDGGEDWVTIDYQDVAARHYRVTGDVAKKLWYGADGLLIKMSSVERDGSLIVTQIGY